MVQRSADDHQERVGGVIDEIGDFRKLPRILLRMRPGYIEELYETTVISN